jgi:hypothetical protein
MKYRDEIIEEVRRWRDDYARRRRFSLKHIVADLQADRRSRHAVACSQSPAEPSDSVPVTRPEQP